MEPHGDNVRIVFQTKGSARAKSACNGQQEKDLSGSCVAGQVRGERGGGDAAKQGLFLFIRKDSVWRLACDSAMERNIAITLIQCYVDD